MNRSRDVYSPGLGFFLQRVASGNLALYYTDDTPCGNGGTIQVESARKRVLGIDFDLQHFLENVKKTHRVLVAARLLRADTLTFAPGPSVPPMHHGGGASTRVPRSLETAPPFYGGPRGAVAISFERGTPVSTPTAPTPWAIATATASQTCLLLLRKSGSPDRSLSQPCPSKPSPFLGVSVQGYLPRKKTLPPLGPP